MKRRITYDNPDAFLFFILGVLWGVMAAVLGLTLGVIQ